jgi:hypothetical protein
MLSLLYSACGAILTRFLSCFLAFLPQDQLILPPVLAAEPGEAGKVARIVHEINNASRRPLLGVMPAFNMMQGAVACGTR